MKIGIKTKKAVCEFDFTYGLVITLQINHQSITSTTNLYFVFVKKRMIIVCKHL